ncbi:MAG: phosphatidylserine decarboxylase [Bacteroidetes bacterium]|nr:phosphatidylserine decarboxylase [Bacteroidota bacterium]
MANSKPKILLYNRTTASIEEEIVFEEKQMHFFYNNIIGRFISGFLLKRKFVSRFIGNRYNKKSSVKKISPFIEKYNININEITLPVSEYKSFNHFFTRELSPQARPICYEPETLISPADARLLAFKISDETIFPIKGSHFTLSRLTNCSESIKPFINGTCLIYRLAPADYHRFINIDDGYQDKPTTVEGFLHSVNPISLATGRKVFIENHREVSFIKTDNFKTILNIEVGALLVGKIILHKREPGKIERGKERGYFEFGASTIIQIFQPQTVIIDNDILENSAKNVETIVKMGERVGIKYLIK